tara:strand:+ start:36354 stop:36872 length:519 start_codon:yes stop_codon:yes gene_type:complete
MFTLLIWAAAAVTIPIKPVPLTLQTVAILLVALLLPMKYALFSVGLYIALGAVGVPVFSGGRSGVDVITGSTGGFIIGFMVAAAVVSYLTAKIRYNVKDKKVATLYGQVLWPCFIGSVILQICGVIWGKVYTGASWGMMYDQWIHPFYLNMVIKILIAVVVAVQIWKETSKQ